MYVNMYACVCVLSYCQFCRHRFFNLSFISPRITDDVARRIEMDIQSTLGMCMCVCVYVNFNLFVRNQLWRGLPLDVRNAMNSFII